MVEAVVIGGGAAGLCCAGFALRRGARVTVLERGSRPARKVLVTGKGRCNVTNDCGPETFLQNVRTNGRFLYGAIHSFPPADAMALFEELGVPLKTERGNRVFPVSDRAADIAAALSRFAGGAALRGVRLEGGETLPADRVVIATGGLSYPATGSTGDGYRLAAELGHTVMPQRPSLVSVDTREPWCAELAGLSLRNVTLTLKNAKNKVIYRELGEMLFTHRGVSGPLVLSASAFLDGEPGSYRMTVDLKPGLEEKQLDARLLRDFAQEKNRDFKNALGALLPRRLIPVAVRLCGIPPETKVNAVTREQRRALAAVLKALPLTPSALGPLEEAVVTSGGVSVREVNPSTMESKLVRGLYFAGEVLDVDAFTGGFNLQIAWSTGFLAGNNLI